MITATLQSTSPIATAMRSTATPPAVEGTPRIILRAEGAAGLALACFAYAAVQGSWAMFAILFLVPDLSMLGYLAGPQVGALIYNFAHTYLAAGAVSALGWFGGDPMLVGIGLIWAAHVGFDRMMGYGLKYASAFGDTHLSNLRKEGAE